MHLSGFSIEPGRYTFRSISLIHSGTVPPSPTVVQASTVETDHVVTPSSTAVDITAPAPINMQQAQQQRAIRMLQDQLAQASANNGTNQSQLSPAVLQGIMAATKNGNIDSNTLQQFKQLYMYQQAQKQAQAMNPATVRSNAPGVTGDVEQMMQAAIAQQKQQQAQAQAQGQPSAPPAGNAPSRPSTLWTGDISWAMHHNAIPVSGESSVHLPY